MKPSEDTSADTVAQSDTVVCNLKIFTSKFLTKGQCALLLSNKSSLRQSLIAIQSQLQKKIEALDAHNTPDT